MLFQVLGFTVVSSHWNAMDCAELPVTSTPLRLELEGVANSRQYEESVFAVQRLRYESCSCLDSQLTGTPSY